MRGRGAAGPRGIRWTVAALLLGAAWPAAAQRERDLRQVPVQNFALTDWGGRLGFETLWRSEEQTSEDGSDFERSLLRFEEYIELTGEGFVYHPLFMTYEGRVRLGLLQQSFESDPGDSDSVNELLQEYDATVHFFQEKPVSLILRARRRDDIVRDLFSDVVQFEETSLGADVLFDVDFAPSRLSYTHREVERTGFSSDSDSTLDTVEFTSRVLPWTNYPTDVRYQYRDWTEEFTSRTGAVSVDRTTDLRSHDLTVDNYLRFGRQGRHRLTSSGRFYDQTGSVDVMEWRARQRLDLRHTDRFDTHYGWSFDEVETNTQRTRTHRLNAGFHHRLYESLDTFGEVRHRQTEFDQGDDETVIGAGLRFAYRKRTPRGLLSAGYSFDIDDIDRGAGGTSRTVVDEPVVLIDGPPIFLDQANIFLASVVVTDVTGLIVYVENLDYRLIEVGNRLQIERIFAGAIANGQLVLVDYQFFQEEDIAFTQIAQAFNVRHDWNEGWLDGLALYYRLSDLRNSGDTGGSELLEFTDHVIGFNYRWRWLDWTEEVEFFDANISPFNSFRSALHAQFSPWRRSRLRAGIEYLIIDFRESGEEDTDLFNLVADLRTPIGRRTELEFDAIYRIERGRNDEDSLGLGTFLRWSYRKLAAELGLRYEMLDRSGTDRDDIVAYLQVTREL